MADVSEPRATTPLAALVALLAHFPDRPPNAMERIAAGRLLSGRISPELARAILDGRAAVSQASGEKNVRIAILAEACRRLALKPREKVLMRDCTIAWSMVPNGNLLITPGRVPAARRLIERGYLTQSANQAAPFDPVGFGLVVVATQDCFDKLITDANACEFANEVAART